MESRVAAARQQLTVRAVPNVAPNLALMGITQVGDRSQAWLVDMRTREREIAGRGEQAFGWTVRRIGPESVDLARGTATVRLKLGDRPVGGDVAAVSVPAGSAGEPGGRRGEQRGVRSPIPLEGAVPGAVVAYPVPVPAGAFGGTPVGPDFTQAPPPETFPQGGEFGPGVPPGYANPNGPAYPYGLVQTPYGPAIFPYGVPDGGTAPWLMDPYVVGPGGLSGYPSDEFLGGSPNLQAARRSGRTFSGYSNPNSPPVERGNPQTLRRRGNTDPSLDRGTSPSSVRHRIQ
jgi:hypothetical protein